MLDAQIRRHVYDATLANGRPPSLAAIATATGFSEDAVASALAQLASSRVLVLQPGNGEILMAPPFSSVPTPFLVRTRRHAAYANCAWDALGVSVMLREPAAIDSSCACCGDAIGISTTMTHPPGGQALIHFAVPARRWWEDIVYT